MFCIFEVDGRSYERRRGNILVRKLRTKRPSGAEPETNGFLPPKPKTHTHGGAHKPPPVCKSLSN